MRRRRMKRRRRRRRRRTRTRRTRTRTRRRRTRRTRRRTRTRTRTRRTRRRRRRKAPILSVFYIKSCNSYKSVLKLVKFCNRLYKVLQQFCYHMIMCRTSSSFHVSYIQI